MTGGLTSVPRAASAATPVVLPGNPQPDPYDAIYRDFRWQIPREFNWFEACCARWARQTPLATALVCEHERGDVAAFNFADLHSSALRLAGALSALLGDPDRRARLGAQARQDAVDRHSWDRYVSCLEQVYSAAIADGGSPGPA
jgi:hypothetical protein